MNPKTRARTINKVKSGVEAWSRNKANISHYDGYYGTDLQTGVIDTLKNSIRDGEHPVFDLSEVSIDWDSRILIDSNGDSCVLNRDYFSKKGDIFFNEPLFSEPTE